MEISNVSYANILIYWMEKKIIYVLLKAVSAKNIFLTKAISKQEIDAVGAAYFELRVY